MSDSITWQKSTPETVLFDGDQLLVAFQIHNRYKPGTYLWEYAVIRVSCGPEQPTTFECNDEPWDFEWADVECFIPLSEFRLPEIAT